MHRQAAIQAIHEWYSGDHDPSSVSVKVNANPEEIEALWSLAEVGREELPFLRCFKLVKDAVKSADGWHERMCAALVINAVLSSLTINPPLNGRVLSNHAKQLLFIDELVRLDGRPTFVNGFEIFNQIHRGCITFLRRLSHTKFDDLANAIG